MSTRKSATTPISAGLFCLAMSLFSVYITFTAFSATDILSGSFIHFIGYLSILLILLIILVYLISVFKSAYHDHAFLKPNPILCTLSLIISLTCFLILTF